MTDNDVLPPRIWAGAGSDDVLTSLGVDGFIVERFNAKRLPKFIHKLPYVQRITRRAMEVGYLEAMRARREQPGPIAKDFDNLDRLAAWAESALDKLIKHLEPCSARALDLTLSILTAQAGLHPAQELHLQAEKDAAILWAARETVRRLKETASKKEGRVRKGRQNPGKPDHIAFLWTLAEAWVYLTGRKPGSNPDHSGNPFLRFSALAWDDVFGPEKERDPEFSGALRKLPDWSAFQLSQLKSNGPSWL